MRRLQGWSNCFYCWREEKQHSRARNVMRCYWFWFPCKLQTQDVMFFIHAVEKMLEKACKRWWFIGVHHSRIQKRHPKCSCYFQHVLYVIYNTFKYNNIHILRYIFQFPSPISEHQPFDVKDKDTHFTTTREKWPLRWWWKPTSAMPLPSTPPSGPTRATRTKQKCFGGRKVITSRRPHWWW